MTHISIVQVLCIIFAIFSILFFNQINGACSSNDLKIVNNQLGPGEFDKCYGRVRKAPSNKYYCITAQGAKMLKYKCPANTALSYIRDQSDYDDWKFLRGMYNFYTIFFCMRQYIKISLEAFFGFDVFSTDFIIF